MSQPDPHENLLVIEDKCLISGKATKYVKVGFLGKGGFARCYEFIRQDTKEVCAIKIIQKANLVKPRSKQKLQSEIQIHEGLHHANIVEFRHTFEDNLNVYLVLELCTNQTLNDLLKRKKKLSQSEIQYYMLQLVDALIYLHGQKVIHRDLKLGNLFLSDKMTVRLGDFGLASKLDFPGEKRRTICGTPNYIAPEILDSRGHSYEVDVWSFGIILYTLAFGRPPFESKDVKETYKKIKLNMYSFPEHTASTPRLRALITIILQKDPARRPSLDEVREHEFFQGASLSRQPSLRSQISVSALNRTSSYKESQRELSDNGKLYTNNDIGSSKDVMMKSQDRFTNTERNPSCLKSTPLRQQNIQRIRSQRMLKEVNREKENEEVAEVAVRKWIDYSNKYGIGYLLSNRSYGVYFNDSTKMVAQNEECFYYLERQNKEDVLKKYKFADYPADLKKKVGLFNHFKGYLKDEEAKNELVPIDPRNLVYIKRWFRSKHSVIFRMSNKTVQVIFIDQTELIINSTTKKVAYFNKGHQRFEYPIQEIMESDNKELIKRFQYTKEVLNEMAKAHDQKKEEEGKGPRDKLCDRDPFANTLHTPLKLGSTQSQIRLGRFNETTPPFK